MLLFLPVLEIPIFLCPLAELVLELQLQMPNDYGRHHFCLDLFYRGLVRHVPPQNSKRPVEDGVFRGLAIVESLLENLIVEEPTKQLYRFACDPVIICSSNWIELSFNGSTCSRLSSILPISARRSGLHLCMAWFVPWPMSG